MTTLYNDTDPKAAAWLRELVSGGHITKGPVNERSISDLDPDDLRYFNRVHLFAGIGGWDYALKLAGWPDDRPVWTGSCPCQPFSSAGKRKGTEDARHLWPDMCRLIRECRPPVVFGEQVASKDGLLWLDGVQADLEAEGYSFGAADLCAAGVGAPHIRQRLYWVADAGIATSQRNARGLPAAQAGVGGENGPKHGHCGVRPEHGSDAGGLANAMPAGRTEGRPGAGCRSLASSSSAGGLGHAASRGDGPLPFGGGDRESEGERRERGPGGSGAVGGLVHHQHGRPPEQEQRPEPGGTSRNGHWSDFEIVWCRDPNGGSPIPRRVEPGTFPLDHGVPGRVAQLRGLGNAIVPQVAAEFVMAYLESSL